MSWAGQVDTLAATTVSFGCDALALAIGHTPAVLDWLREFRQQQAPADAVLRAAAAALDWQHSRGKLVQQAQRSNIGDMPMREGAQKIWAQRSPPPVADAEGDDEASLEAAGRAALKHQVMTMAGAAAIRLVRPGMQPT